MHPSAPILRLLAAALALLAGIAGISAQEERSSGVIGRLDSVEIRVFREDDLTTRGQLSADGSITVPLIGQVKLQGLTTDQAARLIERRLADGYLVKPEATVSIAARLRRSVTVLGQAQRPGVFEIPAHRELTLVEAIGMAGGLTRIANTRKVTIKGSGGVRIVNLKDIAAGKGTDVRLKDGDVIHIPESLF